MEWSYTFRLRSRHDGTATPLHTFEPDPFVGREIGPPTYEQEYEERQLIYRHRRVPFIYGYRARLTAAFLAGDGRITPASGFDELDEVLSDACATPNYLECSLHGAGAYGADTSPDYKRVNLVSPWEPSRPGGKTTAMAVELELEGYELQATIYPPEATLYW